MQRYLLTSLQGTGITESYILFFIDGRYCKKFVVRNGVSFNAQRAFADTARQVYLCSTVVLSTVRHFFIGLNCAFICSDYLGLQMPPRIESIEENSRASFPLGVNHPSYYVKTRMALIGLEFFDIIQHSRTTRSYRWFAF
jgi:hypothetical protein